jgi:hypothetical protein
MRITYEGSPFFLTVAPSFSLNPLTDVGRAILEFDANAFTARQELHRVSTHECYVLQIQNQMAIAGFQRENSLQLRNVFRFDSTTQSKEHLPVR